MGLACQVVGWKVLLLYTSDAFCAPLIIHQWAKTLVYTIITSRTDYCNGVFSWVAVIHLCLVQTVLNAAAWLNMKKRKYELITVIISDVLQWNTSFVTLSVKLCIILLHISNRTVLLCQHTKVKLIFTRQHSSTRRLEWSSEQSHYL